MAVCTTAEKAYNRIGEWKFDVKGQKLDENPRKGGGTG